MLELALLAGVEEPEVQDFMRRGISRSEAISEFLKREKLTVTDESLKTEQTPLKEKGEF